MSRQSTLIWFSACNDRDTDAGKQPVCHRVFKQGYSYNSKQNLKFADQECKLERLEDHLPEVVKNPDQEKDYITSLCTFTWMNPHPDSGRALG